MNAKKTTKPSGKKTQSAKRASPPSPPRPKKKPAFKLDKTSPFPATPNVEPQLAVVQELTGFAILALPHDLRTTFADDEILVNEAQDLQGHELLLTIRSEGRVAFVHLPFIVMEMESTVMDLRTGGVALRVIASKPPTTDADKPPATASSKAIKRTTEGERRA